MRAQFAVRMGNVDDPKDAELIQRASPLNFANKIVRPLLIGQGANDPRVKQSESEQIVDAVQKNNGSVTYVIYPDEGHGFARPENRTDFNARAEAFLGANLGGRIEPMSGDKIPVQSPLCAWWAQCLDECPGGLEWFADGYLFRSEFYLSVFS